LCEAVVRNRYRCDEINHIEVPSICIDLLIAGPVASLKSGESDRIATMRLSVISHVNLFAETIRREPARNFVVLEYFIRRGSFSSYPEREAVTARFDRRE
jgi:hypothetical protein